MNDAIERGAIAMFNRDFCGNEDWADQREADRIRYRELSAAALLAALDPEDEALVQLMARASVIELAAGSPIPDDLHELDVAATRAGLRALREHIAQGESAE